MQDQVLKAQGLGIPATFLSSTLTRDERESRQDRLAKGDFKLLYVTPERFRKPEFLKAIEGRKIQLLAVDEAHCISQWGHDFRPDYSRVGEFRALLGNPPTLALTATATPEVQKDILAKLKDTCTQMLYLNEVIHEIEFEKESGAIQVDQKEIGRAHV